MLPACDRGVSRRCCDGPAREELAPLDSAAAAVGHPPLSGKVAEERRCAGAEGGCAAWPREARLPLLVSTASPRGPWPGSCRAASNPANALVAATARSRPGVI